MLKISISHRRVCVRGAWQPCRMQPASLWCHGNADITRHRDATPGPCVGYRSGAEPGCSGPGRRAGAELHLVPPARGQPGRPACRAELSPVRRWAAGPDPSPPCRMQAQAAVFHPEAELQLPPPRRPGSRSWRALSREWVDAGPNGAGRWLRTPRTRPWKIPACPALALALAAEPTAQPGGGTSRWSWHSGPRGSSLSLGPRRQDSGAATPHGPAMGSAPGLLPPPGPGPGAEARGAGAACMACRRPYCLRCPAQPHSGGAPPWPPLPK